MKKSPQWDPLGPVVVGGVGGSGTRVVAEILLGMDFYLGQCRPDTLDNEWFAQQFFLPHPDLFLNRYSEYKENIKKALSCFGDCMVSEQSTYLSRLMARLGYLFFLYRVWYPNHMAFILKKDFQADLGRYLLETVFPPCKLNLKRGWGWKEPVSWFYLNFLNETFPKMKYIHVMRNGFDVAYGENQLQFQYWRRMLEVQVPPDSALRPRQILNFWIKANKRALSVCYEHLKGRFYIVKLEDLCARPAEQIERMSDFLGVKLLPDQLHRLVNFVKTPASLDRYKMHDSSIFTAEMISQVEELGFSHEKQF